MFKFVLIASLLVALALAAPPRDETEQERLDREALEQYQNENAQYNFDSKVIDNINDGQITRKEQREGGTVRGSYSYVDGYVERHVEYIADKDGYRIIKDEMKDIGDGPQFDPEGQADVEGSMIGKYSIKLDKTDEEKHYKDARA
ncbi:larval cuticle protein 1 [Drosophila eugracilis]|uniref:larval cuticle protein 1 n=1 Tax=Drosophila eugracilis TaxID=29029 RepID=UPI0007E6A8FE|nr:larval cuticle protein 1 [Drosophila eugracilis]